MSITIIQYIAYKDKKSVGKIFALCYNLRKQKNEGI